MDSEKFLFAHAFGVLEQISDPLEHISKAFAYCSMPPYQDCKEGVYTNYVNERNLIRNEKSYTVKPA